MAEENASGRAGVAFSGWGSSPQEAFIAILNNAAKGKTSPSAPVRTRGFVVLGRNTESLQDVQEWCLEQSWNDCLAARYRIRSKPVFGTLFAALSDDSERLHLARFATSPSDPKTHGSILFSPTGEWAKVIEAGFFEDPTMTSSVAGYVRGKQGKLSQVELLLRFLSHEFALPVGRRLVLLAEVVGEPDPAEWEAAKAGLFELLPERMGLVLAGAPADFSLPDDPHYLELDLTGLERRPGPDAYVYRLAALRSDRPTAEDRLGLVRFADALAGLVLHPGTTPLTVAIHGPWGKGKSSFMQMVRTSLLRQTGDPVVIQPAVRSGEAVRRGEGFELPARTDRRRRRRVPRQVVIVEFNAWRYQDSTQIWAGLASAITSRLEAALPWWRRLLTPLAYAWRNRRAELIFELLLPATVAGLVLVLAAVGIPHLREWLDEELASEALAQLFGGVLPAACAVIGSFWIVASRTRRVLAPVSERVLTYIRRPDYRDQMGYQHRVLDDLRFVTRRLRGDRDEPRVIVFIDDLDRCSDEKIMEILQAINLILGESDFYVFLGMDTKMIYRAIEAHYSGNGRPLEPRFAEVYLQKIVQLPFHLPETRPEQRSSFISELFSEAARQAEPEGGAGGGGASSSGRGGEPLDWDRGALLPPVVETPKPVEDTPIELQAFLDFQDYLEDNPRELKRLVNVHRFVKIVLQQEGRPPSPEIQRKLVKWLVFCDRWPDLVDDILAYARDKSASADCVMDALGSVDKRIAEFAACPGPKDVLTAEDLAPDGSFAEAAMISHLVVWEAVEQPTQVGAGADLEFNVS
jgi:hypothetical protein